MIEFKKDIETGKFYNPVEEETEEDEIEIRYDPLTEKPSRIIKKPLPLSSEPDITDVEKTDFCPFCQENIYDVGARDVRILSKELMEKGEAVLLANVTPYSKYSIVIRLAEKHYLHLGEFKEIHFADALELAKDYLHKVWTEGNVSVSNIIMNYLKPAGSSIVHPHIQVIGSDQPLDYQNRKIKKAKEYWQENEASYWQDLVDEEKNGNRFIGETGSFAWISPFAPRGFEHVKGISKRNFINFERSDLEDLSKGITNVLTAYQDLGYNSFNFSIFIPPFDDTQGFSTVIDIVTRSNLDKFYWCEVFAITKLIDEAYTNKTPEEVARNVRKYF